MPETFERVREFCLVIVEKSRIWDHDEGLPQAEHVDDGAGAFRWTCVCARTQDKDWTMTHLHG